jgi:hypothetical protein
MRSVGSAFVDFAVACGLITQLQNAIFGVVSLAAIGADEVPTPTHPCAVIFPGDSKASPTAARDQIHSKMPVKGGFRRMA